MEHTEQIGHPGSGCHLQGALNHAQGPLTLWPHYSPYWLSAEGNWTPGSYAYTYIKMSQPRSLHPELSHAPELL